MKPDSFGVFDSKMTNMRNELYDLGIQISNNATEADVWIKMG